MNTKTKIVLVIFALLVPQVAWANGGTALMWTTLFHLIFYNFLIGIVEWFIITHYLKEQVSYALFWLILANYISWGSGMFFIRLFQDNTINMIFDLEGVLFTWIISMLMLFVITLVFEIPFYFLAIHKKIRNWKLASKTAIVINMISYSAMCSLYLSDSHLSFFTDTKIDQSILNKADKYELFIYKDGQIYLDTLNNSFSKNSIDSIKNDPDFRKYFQIGYNSDRDKINLYLDQHEPKEIYVENFIELKDSIYIYRKNRNSGVQEIDFRAINNRKWQLFCSPTINSEFTIKYENKTDESFGFEVPWLNWSPDQFSILNNKEMLFIISDRLVLMNIETKEIAYITRADSYAVRKLK